MHLTIVHRRLQPHQENWGTALAEGIRKHGDSVRIVEYGQKPQTQTVACWGWGLGEPFMRQGYNVLVIERGYIGDRFEWCSAGWNGLNGRAIFPNVNDGGERWREHFGHLIQPWRQNGSYALIMGQVDGDAALANVNIGRWYRQAVAAMKSYHGLKPAFRPHPDRLGTAVEGAETIGGNLAQALADARFVVTWNSNSGVDAALAGVPVIACDPGSMARPVAAHTLDSIIWRPDRSAWCAQMAWCQWTKAEFSSGFAWEHLRAGAEQ